MSKVSEEELKVFASRKGVNFEGLSDAELEALEAEYKALIGGSSLAVSNGKPIENSTKKRGKKSQKSFSTNVESLLVGAAKEGYAIGLLQGEAFSEALMIGFAERAQEGFDRAPTIANPHTVDAILRKAGIDPGN